jgi:hypothetical protein
VAEVLQVEVKTVAQHASEEELDAVVETVKVENVLYRDVPDVLLRDIVRATLIALDEYRARRARCQIT